jgi:hypothetical protein
MRFETEAKQTRRRTSRYPSTLMTCVDTATWRAMRRLARRRRMNVLREGLRSRAEQTGSRSAPACTSRRRNSTHVSRNTVLPISQEGQRGRRPSARRSTLSLACRPDDKGLA